VVSRRARWVSMVEELLVRKEILDGEDP